MVAFLTACVAYIPTPIWMSTEASCVPLCDTGMNMMVQGALDRDACHVKKQEFPLIQADWYHMGC